jgi:hypothetical protein
VWQVGRDYQAAVTQEVVGRELSVVGPGGSAHSLQEIPGVVAVGVVGTHVNVGRTGREGFWCPVVASLNACSKRSQRVTRLSVSGRSSRHGRSLGNLTTAW